MNDLANIINANSNQEEKVELKKTFDRIIAYGHPLVCSFLFSPLLILIFLKLFSKFNRIIPEVLK